MAMDLSKGEDEKPIDCPRCKKTMKAEYVQKLGPDVRIDVCGKCGGSWFDRGELSQTIEDRRIADRLTEPPIRGSMSSISCPRCGGRLRARREWDVEVDVCISCGGVWLDHGELEELKAQAVKDLDDEEKRRRKEASFYRAIREMGGD
jgi:Zn-finger nucleic acid-binding protein